MADARSHARWLMKRRLALGAAFGLMIAGASALAAPVVHQAVSARVDLASAVRPPPRPATPVPIARLVWTGADVDGDGQPDFANPTGRDIRKTDAYGCGDFGASRDSGERRHEGVDFTADAGQRLVAPISGYVTKIGYAYPGDEALKFVEIANPALHYAARVFYIDPAVRVGQAVHLGQSIGTHHTLEQKYPGGMTDHVHLEIIDTHGQRIDATRLINARYEAASAPVRG